MNNKSQTARRLRDKGLSYAKIATRLNVSDVTIYRWLVPEGAKKNRENSLRNSGTIRNRCCRAIAMSRILARQRGYVPCIISTADLAATFKGKCDVCNSSEKKVGTLHMDHCHKTGKFRGWLCRKCNLGLGRFNDDPKLMARAVTYLLNTK